jgi:hypothetical protein
MSQSVFDLTHIIGTTADGCRKSTYACLLGVVKYIFGIQRSAESWQGRSYLDGRAQRRGSLLSALSTDGWH